MKRLILLLTLAVTGGIVVACAAEPEERTVVVQPQATQPQHVIVDNPSY